MDSIPSNGKFGCGEQRVLKADTVISKRIFKELLLMKK